jgi:hypothetical protein
LRQALVGASPSQWSRKAAILSTSCISRQRGDLLRLRQVGLGCCGAAQIPQNVRGRRPRPLCGNPAIPLRKRFSFHGMRGKSGDAGRPSARRKPEEPEERANKPWLASF